MPGTAASRVAIVGAGIAGLACARHLQDAGCSVSLFDKGRQPGGRCATRHAGPFAFDHGAQYLTASDDRFRRAVAAAEAAGAAGRWTATGSEDGRGRWVGIPGMSGLARHLGTGLVIRSHTRIAGALRSGGQWRLAGDDGAAIDGTFDVVVAAVPAPQAVPLLAAAPALAERAAGATLAPCWALMLVFASPLPTAPSAVDVDDGAVAWICHDGAKPGRRPAAGNPPATWVVHASPGWSRAHLEDDRSGVAAALLAAFTGILGTDGPAPVHLAAHRWRYARVERPVGEPCLYDPALGLGACGDWCLGPRIEAAFLSGLAMAERILEPR